MLQFHSKFTLIILLFLPIAGYGQVESDTIRVRELLKIGDGQLNRGAYDSSYQSYNEARLIMAAYEESLPVLYAEAMYYEGRSLFYLREDQQALELFEQAIELIDDEVPFLHPLRADIYNNYGGTNTNLGYRLKAKPYLEKALEIESELEGPDSRAAAVNHYNLGLVNMYLGEDFTAIQHFMGALPAYVKAYGENGRYVAQLYTNVGILHRNIGELDVAEEYFKRGVNIHLHNDGPNYWNLAYPYTNLGGVYMDREEYDQALNFYSMAKDLCRRNPKELMRLDALVSAGLANANRQLKDYENAHKDIDEAIAIFLKNYYDGHPRFSDFYRIKGNIYLDQNEPEKAEEYFQKAIKITQDAYGNYHPNLAQANERLAKMYYENNEYDKSLKYIELAYSSLSDNYNSTLEYVFPSINNIDDKKSFIRLLNMHAMVLRDRADNDVQDLEDGLILLAIASDSFDAMRKGFLTEESKIFIQSNAVYTFENAVQNLYLLHELTGDAKYLSEAFTYFEKSKSLVLAETLQSSESFAVQGVNPEVSILEQQINAEIKEVEIKLSGEQNDSIQRVLRDRLFVKRRQADSLSVVIKTDYPEYFDLKYPTEVVSAEEVQNSLSPGEAVVSYMAGDSTWYVLSLTTNSIGLTRVLPGKLPEKTLKDFRDLVREPSSDPSEFIPLGYQIYQTLVLEPIGASESIDVLKIIPDGLLYYVPFDALSTSGDPSKPAYLIESSVVHYMNSATLSKAQDNYNDYEQNYLGYAPVYAGIDSDSVETMRASLVPLNGNLEEVEYASSVFGGNVFTAQKATEQSFKDNSASARIIHLAMHANADDEDPMKSGLWFIQGQDSDFDGYLNAFEIYDMDIRSDLIVLSACNTGVGEIRRGEGVMSLSRAFMYAGCPNIVMSLWRASDDPSSRIMQNFFTHLSTNLPKNEALRQAKLDYLEEADPIQSHPAYWASFVLVGNDAPVGKDSKAWLIAIFAVLLVFVVGWQLLRMRKRTSKQ